MQGNVLSAAAGTSVRATRGEAASYTLQTTDFLVFYTGAGGATFTLIAASTNTGAEFIIKNRGTGDLTVSAAGVGGFFTTSVVNTITLVAGESIHIISDGTVWDVVAYASGVIVP